MARDENVTLDAGASWTQITNADVTSITFVNQGGAHMEIKCVNGTTAPADTVYGLVYPPNQGEPNIALTDLAPGVSGANRVFARCRSGGKVWVSHA